MRTAKRLGSGDRISIKIRRMLRRSTAKNTPITAVERTSRGIRNEQAPPVSCARRSRYEETRKNGEIVEGEKHLTHQERGLLRVDAVEKVRQVVLLDHVLRADLMLTGLAINSLLFAATAIGFARLLASARRPGTLLQMRE